MARRQPKQHHSAESSSKKRLSIRKKIFFSLAPALLLFLTAEVFFRVSGLAKSPITPMVLPGERVGLYRFDKNLFWELKPNQRSRFQNVTVVTNGHGLRSDEIEEPVANQFRILSLGESTTFGAGVENNETYSAVLQSYLNRAFETDRFRVINGGVSAYTSFQSLMYLKTAGLALQPDMVIFYHEYNDYLPTYLRASDNTVDYMSLTDQERFESRSRRFQRAMLSLSATYRFITYRIAFKRLQSQQKQQQSAPEAAAQGQAMTAAMVGNESKQMTFPMRVSPEERQRNFEQLLELCRQNDIELVIIHPSYRDSVRHECLLTRFCRQNDVPMLEAHDALHPPDQRAGIYYWDSTHPTAAGHRQLAQHLYRLLIDQKLVDEKEPTRAAFESPE